MTTFSPSTQQLIASLLPDNWPDHPDWPSLAPAKLPAAWARRLSWRSNDPEFARFLDFLEQHGKISSLEAGEWQRQYEKLLQHPPNLHLLFLLIEGRHPEPPTFYAQLPASLSKRFADWHTRWRADRLAVERLHTLERSPLAAETLIYRGIPLAKTLSYRVLQSYLSETRHEHI